MNKEIINSLKSGVKEDDSDLGGWNRSYIEGATIDRYEFLLDLIEKKHQEGKILDIGCLPCHLTFLLQKKGYDVKGIDIEPNRQKKFIEENSLEVKECNIEKDKIPFSDNDFEIVVFTEVLEHLRINPMQALSEINRILEPEGKLVLSTPNLYSSGNFINYLIGRGIVDTYEEFKKLETHGHMGHFTEFTRTEIEKFLEDNGFDIERTFYKSHEKPVGKKGIIGRPMQFLIPKFRNKIYSISTKKK